MPRTVEDKPENSVRDLSFGGGGGEFVALALTNGQGIMLLRNKEATEPLLDDDLRALFLKYGELAEIRPCRGLLQ
jgi:hypothetical protein